MEKGSPAGPRLAPPVSPAERLPEEWETQLSRWGEPRFRSRQVFRWINRKGVWSSQRMTDLPAGLRQRLGEEGLSPPCTIAESELAADGTQKLVLEMGDGARIETVLIPRRAVSAADLFVSEDEAKRGDAGRGEASGVTQCVSCQVGCAMRCGFCASGLVGLKRQMTAAEIVSQVLLGRDRMGSEDRLNGVVLMGMGEPLHNYDAVARALVLLNHAEGMGLSLRRITLSTCGLVPGIERLGEDFGGRIRLAVSLHAADDETRSRIMPVNRKYPLGALIRALRRYPVSARGGITVEYTLIRGINDRPEDAGRLAELLRGIRAKVNLIPVNRVPGVEFDAPSEAAVDDFQRILRGSGVPAFLRRRRGDDIAAACGQLALREEITRALAS